MKIRLDQYLVQNGLVQSRERAKALIMAGVVFVNQQKVDKAGEMIKEDAVVEVRGHDIGYVSRGGLKLEKAMQCFPLTPKGKVCMDIGASTGGTDIVALILAKYTSMEIGKALMVSDILIVLAAAWRFGMGTGLYCILGLIGKSFVVDGAIENIRLRKVCTRQEHCEHQIQHGVTAHGNVDGIEPLARRHEKGQRKGRIDRPAHGPDAQKDEAQHHQDQVDDPHKAAHVDPGEQVCQQNGQARGAAKCKMVGVFKVYDADRSQDQAKVQLSEEI